MSAKCKFQFQLPADYMQRWAEFTASPEGQRAFMCVETDSKKAAKVLMEYIDDVCPRK